MKSSALIEEVDEAGLYITQICRCQAKQPTPVRDSCKEPLLLLKGVLEDVEVTQARIVNRRCVSPKAVV